MQALEPEPGRLARGVLVDGANVDEQAGLLGAEVEERQTALRRQAQAKREPEMTWVEGVFGFVNELKKGLKE